MLLHRFDRVSFRHSFWKPEAQSGSRGWLMLMFKCVCRNVTSEEPRPRGSSFGSVALLGRFNFVSHTHTERHGMDSRLYGNN